MGFSIKRNCNPPVEGINRKFQGLEKKSLEFQGGTTKIEEKTLISRGVNVKNQYPQQRGGGTIFFPEKPI